jgi:hypothetical protein
MSIIGNKIASKFLLILIGYSVVIVNRGLAYFYMLKLISYDMEFSRVYSEAMLLIPLASSILSFNCINYAIKRYSDKSSLDVLQVQALILSIIFVVSVISATILMRYDLLLFIGFCYLFPMVDIKYASSVLVGSNNRMLVQNFPFIFIYGMMLYMMYQGFDYTVTISLLITILMMYAICNIYYYRLLNITNINFQIKERGILIIGSSIESLIPTIAVIIMSSRSDSNEIIYYNLNLSTIGLLSSPAMIFFTIFSQKITFYCRNSILALYKTLGLVLCITLIVTIIFISVINYFSLQAFQSTNNLVFLILGLIAFQFFWNALYVFIINVINVNKFIILSNILIVLFFILFSFLFELYGVSNLIFSYASAFTIRSIYQFYLIRKLL